MGQYLHTSLEAFVMPLIKNDIKGKLSNIKSHATKPKKKKPALTRTLLAHFHRYFAIECEQSEQHILHEIAWARKNDACYLQSTFILAVAELFPRPLDATHV